MRVNSNVPSSHNRLLIIKQRAQENCIGKGSQQHRLVGGDLAPPVGGAIMQILEWFVVPA